MGGFPDLSKVPNPNSELRTPNSLVQAGKQYYHAGKFSDAAQALQQAAQRYAASQDVIKASTSSEFTITGLSRTRTVRASRNRDQLQCIFTRYLAQGELVNRVLAQVFNRQGRLFLAQGKTEQALANFAKTELLYKQAEDKIGVIGSQINQAQALQNLGFYRRSQKLFTQIENKLETEPDSLLKVKSWHHLGNIRRQGGDLDSSQINFRAKL